MTTETVLWIAFALLIILILGIDLGVFNRRAHHIKFKEALIWSIVWINIALLFDLVFEKDMVTLHNIRLSNKLF